MNSGNINESPVRPFTPGKLTAERLNELVKTLEAHARRINAADAERENARASGPVPCKITEVVSVGKYYATAYLPPYRASEPDPENIDDLAESDLGTRTQEVIVWNLSELSGGGALAVDSWVDASVAGFDPSGYPLMKTGGSGSSPILTRMKVTTAANSSRIALAKTWDGTTLGTDAVPVRIASVIAVDQVFVASQVSNSGLTYSGSPVLWWEAAADFTLFPVALTQTGGSAGNLSTKCSFSYTVKDQAGSITLGTGITPEQQTDYQNKKRAAATKGQAYIASDGTVKLFCHEDGTPGNCP